MMLITGASGHLGQAVIHSLARHINAGQIAALVRDLEGAPAKKLAALGVQVRRGDYDDVASLDAAMMGVDSVLLISGTDEARRIRQHQNVIEAAQRAGVARIAYTSRALTSGAASENSLMDGHLRTEELIRASGMRYVIFRNALYLDTVPIFIGGAAAFDTGIHLPVGDGEVAYALRSELGEAMARVLREPLPESRTLLLTAHRAWSFADIAAALGELAGHPVAFTDVDRASFEATMRAKGLPEPVIQRIYGFYSDIKSGQLNEVSPTLCELLGREPIGLRDGLAQLLGR
jgi:NAD(P)H dehydrogenase (quinone)